MKRLLYLVPGLWGHPGGIERYCRMVCRALTENGNRLHVLALTDHPDARANEFGDLANLRYWPCGGSQSRFIRRAIQASLQDGPDLILVGHPNFAPLGWFLSRVWQVPWVVFIYGIDAWQRLSLIRRSSLVRADRVISISHLTAHRAVAANHICSNRIRIVPNGLDPQIKIPQLVSKMNSNLSMLTVARLEPSEQYKGHDYVIQAMPQLLERFPDLVYTIIGDGPLRPALEQFAARQGVVNAVRFLGFVSEQELQQQYARADLFIMPSRGEGFGFVFLEAMAYGVPAIGGNMDATPEVIVDGETGYLVNPTSVDAIVQAAARLLGDKELREQMGQAAARHVRKNFGFPLFKRRLLTYLEELRG